MKTIENNFADWESHVFGYGYGTGESHVLAALRDFFSACNGYNYDYRVLQNALGTTVAWLLINTLAHADIIEYGTSARYGWMTYDHGRALADFVRQNSLNALLGFCNHDSEYVECYPDHCNCEDGPCHNPFWRDKRKG